MVISEQVMMVSVALKKYISMPETCPITKAATSREETRVVVAGNILGLMKNSRVKTISRVVSELRLSR